MTCIITIFKLYNELLLKSLFHTLYFLNSCTDRLVFKLWKMKVGTIVQTRLMSFHWRTNHLGLGQQQQLYDNFKKNRSSCEVYICIFILPCELYIGKADFCGVF